MSAAGSLSNALAAGVLLPSRNYIKNSVAALTYQQVCSPTGFLTQSRAP